MAAEHAARGGSRASTRAGTGLFMLLGLVDWHECYERQKPARSQVRQRTDLGEPSASVVPFHVVGLGR